MLSLFESNKEQSWYECSKRENGGMILSCCILTKGAERISKAMGNSKVYITRDSSAFRQRKGTIPKLIYELRFHCNGNHWISDKWEESRKGKVEKYIAAYKEYRRAL